MIGWTIGWILAGVGILAVNGLVWMVIYRRVVGRLMDRVARLENRLAHHTAHGWRLKRPKREERPTFVGTRITSDGRSHGLGVMRGDS